METGSVEPSARRVDRFDLGVLVVLAALAVYVAVVIARAPRIIGEYEDDGIYLATAKSLADGHGYHHPHLPGTPGQTKYPILYPLLLAGLWRVFPDFDGISAAIPIVNTVLWAAGSWAAYLVMRRAWKVPWWLPACGVALAFAHTGTLGLLQTAMSEPLYLTCSMAALLALRPGAASSERPPRGLGFVSGAAAGFFAAAAYLTRSIGLAVIVAVLAELIARRRWRALLVAAGIIALVIIGWQAWCLHATAANANNPAAAAMTYDLNYSSWLPHSLATLGRVVMYNAVASAGEFYILVAPFRVPAIEAVLNGQAPGLIQLHIMVTVAAALALAGAVAAFNRAAPALHIYLAVYLGLVLIWPFPPMRFLLPVFPLLVTCLLAGLYAVVLRMVRLATLLLSGTPAPASAEDAARTPAEESRLPAVAVLVVSALLLYANVRLIAAADLEQSVAAVRRREGLVALLVSRTPPDAVICCDMAGCIHVRTGRGTVPFLQMSDPLPFIYAEDRPLGGYGRVITRGEVKNVIRHVQSGLADYLRATGASYIVPLSESTTYGIAFAEFRARHPGWFRLVETIDGYSLYRVQLPAVEMRRAVGSGPGGPG